ncbi:MAG: PAS domain-containing protein [Deltaproteobacteria bacterium]|jgi:two-component system sensor histidine kinase HydH|nr:PAS domain-containing protein [Deltaproteobacteria bacterium]
MFVSKAPLGIDYLSRPTRFPTWLRVLTALALFGLAVAAFFEINDLDRESKNLQQLFLIKGESHIKYMGLAMGREWLDDKAPDGLSSILVMERDPDVVFLATSNYLGEIRGLAMRQPALTIPSLGVPEPPETFHPQWEPRFKTLPLSNGQMVFVVYRPTLLNLLPPMKPEHHPEKQTAAPPWPPEGIDFSHPENAVYVWVGYSMLEFDKARSQLRINAMIFSFLTLLVIISIIMAVSWLLRSMRSYALTNEIVTRLPLGLIINNPEGQVVLANQAALKLSGLTEEEFLGHSLKELTHDAFPDEKELTAREMDISFKDSPSLRLAITCGPITGHGGKELGRVVLISDLGEFNRLKDALAKQERMARLGGLASGLAHEIRNPLGAIKGLTQHLIHKTKDDDEKDALTVINNCVERMARTITDFQAYANPAINSERLELSEFLTDLHDEITRKLDSNAISMNLSLPKERLFVQADPSQLSAALTSLYNNAVKAVEGNPPDKPGLLKIVLRRVGTNRASIIFSDNGPGFGQKQLETPFVPYFSSSALSSGLGLAKANNVIGAFRGTIKLANNAGGGALVTVTLPLEYQGVSDLRLSNLDMVQFLKDIHSFMAYDSKFKNLSMDLDLPEKILNVRGDKDLLTQAITNIYLNARQATEANPPERPGHLTVKLNRLEKNLVSVVFTDNGPGFDQTQLENPFVPYYTTKAKGMGMGMSIIRNIVEAHHGEVKIENSPEGGGQVTVIMPYAGSFPVSPRPQEPLTASGRGNGQGA